MSCPHTDTEDVRTAPYDVLVRRICATCDDVLISETRDDGTEWDWINGEWRQR